jgi:hypothetical protein
MAIAACPSWTALFTSAHVGRGELQELQEDLAALAAGRGVERAAPGGIDQLGAVGPLGDQHVERGLDVAAGGDGDPVLLLARVVQRLGGGHQLVPGGRGLEPLLLEQVLAIDEELDVAVDRQGVLRALEHPGGDGGGNEVHLVERLHPLVERQQELRERRDPGLVDEQDVVAPAGAERQQLLLVQVREGRRVDDDLDAGLLLELRQVRAEHVLLVAGEHREGEALALRPRRGAGRQGDQQHEQHRGCRPDLRHGRSSTRGIHTRIAPGSLFAHAWYGMAVSARGRRFADGAPRGR